MNLKIQILKRKAIKGNNFIYKRLGGLFSVDEPEVNVKTRF